MTPPSEAEAALAQPGQLSEVLAGFGDHPAGVRVTLGDLLERLGERSFGAVLLVLGLCALLPVLPPGVASIFGAGLVAVATQMLIGRPKPALPRRVLGIGMERDRVRRFTARVLPWVRRAERTIRRRPTRLTGPAAERWLGGVILLMSLVICVPLPMTNAPPAASVVVLAVGLLAGDGLCVLAGLIMAVLSLALVVLFWAGAWMGMSWALGW